jgi:hypothetical protein
VRTRVGAALVLLMSSASPYLEHLTHQLQGSSAGGGGGGRGGGGGGGGGGVPPAPLSRYVYS